MPWILNLAYGLFLLAVSPILLYRIVVHQKYRDGWKQKFLGHLPRLTSHPKRIWFHAVSVGEVIQLRSVVAEVQCQIDDCEIVISTTTSTGFDVARKQFSDEVVCYFPLDFSWSVNAAFNRIKPTIVSLVELELWPNFIHAASKRGIKIGLINARISERSFRGYCRLRPLMQWLLPQLTHVAAQNAVYANRLKQLGLPDERVSVTGSIKFDRIETDRNNPGMQSLRRALGIRDSDQVFIAGSTQFPEEEFALESWLTLREQFPNLRLVLVPRHKERFEEVARMVKSRDLPLIRRSHTIHFSESANQHCLDMLSDRSAVPPVLLLDTLGELAGCWGLADIAFVGGSLTNRGGQNMIEPAGFGAAVLFGPNTQNFRDVVELLLTNEAARVVKDQHELQTTVCELLADPVVAKNLGSAAQQLVLQQQGATAATVEILRSLVDQESITQLQHAA